MNKKIFEYATPILVALVAFITIIGINVLNPSNIKWIADEDQWQIYLSPIFFSMHPWSPILGLNPMFGLEISSAIAFNASVLAFPHKALSYLFDIHNQYLGYWFLACFLGQGVFSWKILSLYTKDFSSKLLGCGFFLFSPPMLFRVDLHILLVAHFLILWAIYLNLKKQDKYWPQLSWLVVLSLSAMLHFYIFIIVGGMWLAGLLDGIFNFKQVSTRKALSIATIAILVVMFISWQMGYFTISMSSAGEFGFGFFRAHLLTFFDSAGWSYILPSIPTSNLKFGNFALSQGVYEGFAFIGLGGILLTIASVFGYGYCRFYSHEQEDLNIFHGRIFLFFIMVIFFLIAISNNVTLYKWNVNIFLPQTVLELMSIFRASGRAIWPVFYILLIYLIYLIIRLYPKKIATMILGACLLVQIIDTSAGWYPLAQKFKYVKTDPPSNILKHNFWNIAKDTYSSIRIEPLSAGLKQANWLIFSYFSSRYNISTNAIYQGRVDLTKVAQANHKFDLAMSAGQYDPKSLYIIDDDLVIPVAKSLNRKQDLFARIDGFNVLAPGWLTCATCPSVSPELLISPVDLPLPKLDTSITFDKGGTGTSYLLGIGQFERLAWGWAYPESWGVWSEGRQSKLLIPYPLNTKPTSLTLFTKALIGPNHPSQRVEIWINHQLQKTVMLNKTDGNLIEIALPKDTVRDFALIDLHFPDAISAKELGLGDDVRKLAIGLESAVLR